jgi:hypothetical protein
MTRSRISHSAKPRTHSCRGAVLVVTHDMYRGAAAPGPADLYMHRSGHLTQQSYVRMCSAHDSLLPPTPAMCLSLQVPPSRKCKVQQDPKCTCTRAGVHSIAVLGGAPYARTGLHKAVRSCPKPWEQSLPRPAVHAQVKPGGNVAHCSTYPLCAQMRAHQAVGAIGAPSGNAPCHSRSHHCPDSGVP